MEGIKDENGRITENIEEVATDNNTDVKTDNRNTGNIVEGNEEITESKILLLDETEEIDKEIQKKPKKKRTEKQIQAFELARKKRAENIEARKKEKEANTKPVGRPKKVKKKPEPEPEPELAPVKRPEVEDVIQEEEEEEEIIEYRKKPKKKKPKKKIVYVSSSSEEEEEEELFEDEVIVKELQKPKLVRQQAYTEQEQYRAPTSITDFYKVY